MAKRIPASAPTSKRPEEADAERIQRLIDAVEAVADQIAVLRNVIDDIREEFQWAVRNDRIAPHIVHITSMAKDPLDPQWAAKLNRLTFTDLPAEELRGVPKQAEDDEPAASSAGPKSGQQRTLWE